MPECDWAGNWAQAGVASLRPDPDLDLDLRVSTSHRGRFFVDAGWGPTPRRPTQPTQHFVPPYAQVHYTWLIECP